PLSARISVLRLRSTSLRSQEIEELRAERSAGDTVLLLMPSLRAVAPRRIAGGRKGQETDCAAEPAQQLPSQAFAETACGAVLLDGTQRSGRLDLLENRFRNRFAGKLADRVDGRRPRCELVENLQKRCRHGTDRYYDGVAPFAEAAPRLQGSRSVTRHRSVEA